MQEKLIWNYWSALSAKNVVNTANRIAIITDDPGWHGRKLAEALARHGLKSQYLSLTECEIQLTNSPQILKLPGFDNTLPLGVFVRGVPGGSLEQVISRLNILHILQDLGITVFNNGRAIERTVDKSMTSYLLHKSGIPTPATYVFESLESARTLLKQETESGRRLVIKPLFGSQGIGVQILTEQLLLNNEELNNGLFYLQHLVEKKTGEWEDMRVLVIDGKAVKAMLRKGESWITNRTQGARCLPLTMDATIRQLAEAAAKAVAIDYCGVDLIVDKQGQFQVLEINSIPAWWGLQKVVNDDIASLLIESFVKKIHFKSSLNTGSHGVS